MNNLERLKDIAHWHGSVMEREVIIKNILALQPKDKKKRLSEMTMKDLKRRYRQLRLNKENANRRKKHDEKM